MADTTDFVTGASIATFGGATGAVWIIGNTVRVAFHRNWPALPLVTGLVVAFLLAGTTHHLHNPLDYFLAVLNGCLLFLTATGVQQASNADVKSVEGAQRQGRQLVKWRTPWIPVRKTADAVAAPAGPTAATAPVRQHGDREGGGDRED